MADPPDYGRPSRRSRSRGYGLAEAMLQRSQHTLSDDEIKTALEYLIDKWGWARRCPYCEASSWTVGDELVEGQPFGDPGVFLYVVVTCENCGNTSFVDAEKVGVWPKDG